MILKLINKLHNKFKPKAYDRHIPIDKMEIGNYYCEARNFTTGYWDGEKFLYTRYKFGEMFLDSEDHWDVGAPHGTVKPLQYLGGVWEQ